MKMATRRLFLRGCDAAYQALYLGAFRHASAQRAHDTVVGLLRFGERLPFSYAFARLLRSIAGSATPATVGGVRLSQRLILAAGLVKGDGFADEGQAMGAAQAGRNILPGWRLAPTLLGPVEFGSFTRYPRLGNAGRVIWRHGQTRSTQNRVGLRNPGARAAALFLSQRRDKLPPEYGINIALSPGVRDLDQQECELRESLAFFLDAGVTPSWFTLNLSCPNTEDDPQGFQLEDETQRLCRAFIESLRARGLETPLWVKISPGLAEGQYHALMRVFAAVGVEAVVATNTLAKPSPGRPSLQAGVGGGALHAEALAAVEHLAAARKRKGYRVDIIGCGGVMDGASFRAFGERGVMAAQYWSALVYRGPMAAALIESEMAEHEPEYEAVHRERLA